MCVCVCVCVCAASYRPLAAQKRCSCRKLALHKSPTPGSWLCSLQNIISNLCYRTVDKEKTIYTRHVKTRVHEAFIFDSSSATLRLFQEVQSMFLTQHTTPVFQGKAASMLDNVIEQNAVLTKQTTYCNILPVRHDTLLQYIADSPLGYFRYGFRTWSRHLNHWGLTLYRRLRQTIANSYH